MENPECNDATPIDLAAMHENDAILGMLTAARDTTALTQGMARVQLHSRADVMAIHGCVHMRLMMTSTSTTHTGVRRMIVKKTDARPVDVVAGLCKQTHITDACACGFQY